MYRAFSFLVALIFLFSVSTALAQEASNPLIELKNQYSGKCLAVKNASKAHGATLIHKECGSGGLDAIWDMRPEGIGYWIINKSSGLCLGVAHQSKKDGEQVTQVSPCSRPDTLWKVEYMTPGQSLGVEYGKPIILRNNNSAKCLALVSGDKIKQYGCPPHRPKTTWMFVDPWKPPTTYKRVFVTSFTRNADILRRTDGDPRGADEICQQAAAAGGLPGKYRAWLSVFDHAKCEGMRMADRGLSNNSTIPYMNICDGQLVKVADNFADLVDGSLDNPISCTERKTKFEGTPGVWTGTRTDGRTVHYEACKHGEWYKSKRKALIYHGDCLIADCCWNYLETARTINFPGHRCLRKLSDLHQGLARFCDGGVEGMLGTRGEDCWTLRWNDLRGEYVRKSFDEEKPLDTGRYAIGGDQEMESLVGNALAKNKNWTQYRWLSCGKKHSFRLYCFEE